MAAQSVTVPLGSIREQTLLKAIESITGQREQDYGSPESNFGIIAGLWSAYSGYNFTPQDVAMMMILLKVARIKNGGGTGDSFVDIAGYAGCGAEIHQSGMSRPTIAITQADKGDYEF